MSRGCQVQAGKATGVRHVARVFSADCGRRCGCCIDRTSLRKAELQLKRCTWSASRLARCAAHSRRHRTEPNPRGSCARYGSSDAVLPAFWGLPQLSTGLACAWHGAKLTDRAAVSAWSSETRSTTPKRQMDNIMYLYEQLGPPDAPTRPRRRRIGGGGLIG